MLYDIRWFEPAADVDGQPPRELQRRGHAQAEVQHVADLGWRRRWCWTASNNIDDIVVIIQCVCNNSI